MLAQQQKIQLSTYSGLYDMIVPKDNLLRKINELIDFTFQHTDYFNEKAKHRYKIEAKNSELKNVHGYGRAISYGITNMQMQGALAIFTVNLKRIVKLTS